jgi:hypothetical protein
MTAIAIFYQFGVGSVLPGNDLDGAHCLDHVQDQIEQHLLQVHAVSGQARQCGAKIGAQHDALIAQLALRQREFKVSAPHASEMQEP